ncbi:phage head closure protein [Levilactobacillus brevis]|uniref:phage head closure protein n=1 Tax=Levilactobacillus brevis TaxID=1580 RepID=UPI0021A71C52|nr:phage head closure protein [Levilactobacillus brevis]MCT3583635.1 head-tail adaptor protein [Levilactobacillus brevis]
MTMKTYDVSRMKHRCQFGVYGNGEMNPNTGAPVQKFVPQFSLWFGEYSQTINQQITLTGDNLTDTKMIVVRHNEQVNQQQLVKIGDTLYRVNNVSGDDEVNSFDVITLVRYQKRG